MPLQRAAPALPRPIPTPRFVCRHERHSRQDVTSKRHIIGTTRTVLFENENKEGYISGFTENYVKVKTPWNPELANTLHEITLTKIDDDGLVRLEFVNVPV